MPTLWRVRTLRTHSEIFHPMIERDKGRPLTEQEIFWSLEQAKAILGDDLEG